MKNFVKIIFRGFGQVMLQNNAWTGMLFLFGIFFNSWIFGLGAILGNIVSTYSAKILRYSKEDINDGLYGFNGTLLGIAILFLFKFSIFVVSIIILGSIFSTIIMHQIKKYRIPVYTAPFVVSTWLIAFIFKLFNFFPIESLLPVSNSLNIFSATFMGFGQVMFQGSIVTGLIFFLAIIINSRKSAIYSLYGSTLGIVIALIFSFQLSAINIGLFGYNAVLCAIALESKKLENFIFATFAIVLSVFLNFWMGNIGIITLTAPFVFATWITLLLKKYGAKSLSMKY